MERMPTVMNHNFAQVPSVQLGRSTFNRSHGYKTTFNASDLIPIYCDEVLPGDTVALNCNLFARMATPIHPIMDNLYLDTFFFFVPNRLLWSNHEKMHGERVNPSDSIDYLTPQVTTPTGGFASGSLADYMGIPVGVNGMENVNAFHFRAYNKIYNDWFRDENLQDSVTENMGDGPDADTDYPILKRNKRHDYFTSCLPTPQKGPEVNLPLGTKAWVQQDPTQIGTGMVAVQNPTTGNFHGLEKTATTNYVFAGNYLNGPNRGLFADLSTASAATINQLRLAFSTQRLLERDMRGGTRYIELLKSHFGVTSPDGRLQRPEYLGGGSSYVRVTANAQQSETTSNSPQGNLAGIGTVSTDKPQGFTKSFTEHGVLLGLCSVRADLTYSQGLDKMWTRRSRFDYYYPELANLGEQAVFSKEIFVDGSANDETVFGYQERWAEYRFKNSRITGQMRSSYSTPLDTWHLSQNFSTRPVLNNIFISENVPMARISAVPSEPDFILDSYFDLKTTRVMPTYSVPSLEARF